jgi:hypothetical protein
MICQEKISLICNFHPNAFPFAKKQRIKWQVKKITRWFALKPTLILDTLDIEGYLG